tara:strand:- start:1681 stop:2910 length:1230 start_codon:yes stop_codon:yes gene_type:complete
MAKKANKINCEGYKDHMMYDPKTGKGKMTKSCQEHLDLTSEGWKHEKPKKKMGGAIGPNFILSLLLLLSFTINAQEESKFKKELKKTFKFSTFYAAVNGETSISDQNIYSVLNDLETDIIETPFDYALTLGVRKIQRFGYENKANTFKDGTEASYSDAAVIGRTKGFEFLFEVDYKRQQGENYIDQHHFLRYLADKWVVKVEYLQDGFADVEYMEASQRYRHKLGRRVSLTAGTVQRISEPYGFDPLAEWVLSNGNLHYTSLALEEGYTIGFDPTGISYLDPSGAVVATNSEIWEEVVIPQVLDDYVKSEKDALPVQWCHSVVIGADYYYYTKKIWLHSWANILPYHLNTGGEYSYHNFNGGNWIDYSGGLIFGYKINKNLGVFVEGKYNKYWNREWHDFKFGINYIIL